MKAGSEIWILSNKAEYLRIQHLPGPVGAGLKEFYSIKPSHILFKLLVLTRVC
jgi:hypothetical protein